MVMAEIPTGENGVPLVVFPEKSGFYHCVQFIDSSNNDYLRFGEIPAPYSEIEKEFDLAGIDYVLIGKGIDEHYVCPRFDYFRDDPFSVMGINHRHLSALNEKVTDHYLLPGKV